MKAELEAAAVSFRFNKHHPHKFVRFDARQKYFCIMRFLEEELNFDFYKDNGVIEDNYPLHCIDLYKEMETAIKSKYYAMLS